MSQLGQILTVVGIILETFAIIWAVRRIFYSWQRVKDERIEQRTRESQEAHRYYRKEQAKILSFLIPGMALQIIGTLV